MWVCCLTVFEKSFCDNGVFSMSLTTLIVYAVPIHPWVNFSSRNSACLSWDPKLPVVVVDVVKIKNKVGVEAVF